MSTKRFRPRESNFYDCNFRPAIKTNGHGKPADAGGYIQWACFGLEQSQIILVHGKGNHYRSVERDAHLSAMRMARQHQIKFLTRQSLDPRGVVHEQKVFPSRIGGR